MRLEHAVLYGDDTAAPADAASRNLRGRCWRSYDPAGVTVEERYDVHNNPQETVRRWLPTDDLIQRADIQDEPQLSWPPDDLSRPEAADNKLAHGMSLDQVRDRTGAVHALTVDGSGPPALTVRYTRDTTGDVTAVDVRQGHQPLNPLIERIIVDAHGQPVLLDRPAGISTRFLRDPATTMLLRQSTEQTSTTQHHVLHDAVIHHDPLGAVTQLSERTPTDGAPCTQYFAYDDLHRLRSATAPAPALPAAMPWEQPADGTTLPFQHTYHYNDVGNLLDQQLKELDQQKELKVNGRTEQRTSELEPGSNRLTALTVHHDASRSTRIDYHTDPAGNILAEGQNRTFSWDHASRLHAARSGSLAATYWYTDNDQRTCTLLVADGQTCSVTHHMQDWLTCTYDRVGASAVTLRITIDGTPNGTPLAWTTSRSATCESVHLLTDHLGSVRAVLELDGSIRQATDYSAYGQTVSRIATGPVTPPRRLGYAAAEEDQGATLLLLGRRPYAPWLGRFLSGETTEDQRLQASRSLLAVSDSADPPNRRIPAWALSPYAYAANSPLTVRDAGGRQAEKVDACKNDVIRAGNLAGTGAGILIGAMALLFVPEVTIPVAVGSYMVDAVAGLGAGDIIGERWLAPEICKLPEPLPPASPSEPGPTKPPDSEANKATQSPGPPKEPQAPPKTENDAPKVPDPATEPSFKVPEKI